MSVLQDDYGPEHKSLMDAHKTLNDCKKAPQVMSKSEGVLHQPSSCIPIPIACSRLVMLRFVQAIAVVNKPVAASPAILGRTHTFLFLLVPLEQ